MKRISIAAALFLCMAAGCSTLDQNVNARKNLSKCRFDFVGLEFVKLHAKSGKFISVDLNLLLRVTNPNETDVALDHIDAGVFIEGRKVADLSHKNFVRIKAGSSADEKVALNVPFSSAWILGKRPHSASIEGTIYAAVMIGEYTLSSTIERPVKTNVPLPWDKIGKALLHGGIHSIFR
jgi:LEA14-like dessication related protein